MEKYPHIFSPGRIGPLTTRNRIKYAATETNFPYGDGYVSDREVAYMEAQARGGAGIITTQGAYPDAAGAGKGFRGMMAIYDDRFIPGLARIADVIRKNDALSCIQILHCGREGGVDLDYCLMASATPQKLSYFKKPREITTEEIKQSVKEHIAAARRAVQAGYDMIEISGIVGYLIATFISRYTNRREDLYGGNIGERCRFMVEIIQGIKAEVGNKVPVGIRLCGTELLDDRGGNSLEESIESFRIAEEAGADYLSVTVGWHESSIPVITRDVPMGHWLWVAEEVKKYVQVPVMMAFRQFIPEIPEGALSKGQIDFWEACRPMIADPEMPRKIAERREDEIIPCIACNVCFSRLYYHQPIMCSVRPSLGHEGEDKWGYSGFIPVDKPRKVVVVGGGPAGLQCASVAAQKGHEVVLLEKNDTLGGAVLLASLVDEGADELLRPVRTLEGECRKHKVDIRLGIECTKAYLAGMEADVIVVASGGSILTIPGITGMPVYSPEDVIGQRVKPPRRLAIVGGNIVGIGVAVFLARAGQYDLTIIEEGPKAGRDVNPFYLWRYMGLLKKQKTVILTGASVVGARGGTISVETPKGERTLEVDGIISALRGPSTVLRDMALGMGREVRLIGDAKRPRRLNNAIHDGYHLGMEI